MSVAQIDPLAEINSLRKEIQILKAENQHTWRLLIEIVRRLQASSTSVKAAVSSLLSYDIFWDVANQHEFLKTIETSADQASALEMLLSLAFRLEAERLELKPEPHSLQEIISQVKSNIKNRFPDFELELSMPLEGQPVLVDYEYLSLSLTLLLQQLIAGSGQNQIHLRVAEADDEWKLELSGLNPQMVKYTDDCLAATALKYFSRETCDPEDVLRMNVVRKLFALQGLGLGKQLANPPADHLVINLPVHQVG